MQGLPTYSDTLVDLARSHDRARMAAHASRWLVDDDQDQGVLGRWADSRLELLEQHLDRMGRAITSLIVAETRDCFEVGTDADGDLILPPRVVELLSPYEMPALFYMSLHESEADVLAKTAHLRGEYYLILDEGDVHILPKAYPLSFVEVWWPRYFRDPLVLVDRPEYGWLSYGHEL